MKILFVINTMGRGGAETALLTLLNRPELREHDVSLYVMLGQGELMARAPESVKRLNRRYSEADVLSDAGKRRLLFRTAGITLRRGALLRSLPYMIRNAAPMRKTGALQPDKLLWRAVAQGTASLKEEYDLAVAYIEGASTYFVSRYVRAARKAAFVHVDYARAGYTPALDEGCYDAFDRIFCVSDEVRQAFLGVYPAYEGKTGVFHNLIDKEIRRRAAEDGGFADGFDGLRLLTVGRLVRQKSIETSIRAMRLLKDRGVRARWYVLGEGEERPALEREIARLGLERDFLLPGVIDNPYPCYRQADIYVHCSRFEGRSIAVQEAQTLGKPIVVSDCSGNREQVTDGEDGLLVELQPEAIADAVERLSTDEALRERLARGAAARTFRDEDIQKLFIDIIQETEKC